MGKWQLSEKPSRQEKEVHTCTVDIPAHGSGAYGRIEGDYCFRLRKTNAACVKQVSFYETFSAVGH